MTVFDTIRAVSPLANGALTLISIFYPAAAPIVSLIERFEPAVIAALPAIQAAVGSGQQALDAAQAASPDFKNLVDRLWTHMPTTEKPVPVDKENITRALAGFSPMTPDEEAEWMDRFTPMSSKDSRFGG